MRRAVALLAVLVLTVAAKPIGNGNESLTLTTDWRSWDSVVEQQSPDWNYASNDYNYWRCTHAEDGTEHPDNCVRNPTECNWDVDDAWSDVGTGVLTGTVRADQCIIQDGHHRIVIYAGVSANSDALTVTLATSEDAPERLVPFREGSQWHWELCRYTSIVAPFSPIPDSNGGVGRRMDYSLTITAARKVGSITAILKTGQGIHGPSSCQ